MKLFLSHSSADKALVREIKSQLHDFLDIWLDERQLIPGKTLVNALEGAVSDSDLLLLFISKDSSNSSWVNAEIDWALERETTLHRPFLIPIILDNSKPPEAIVSRLHFSLSSQNESDVKSLSDELNEKLFHYVVKYGIKDQKLSENDDKNDAEGINKVMDFAVELMQSSKNDMLEKYSSLIEDNIELQPKTILLLCKSELDHDISDLEVQERVRETHEKEENDKEDKNGITGTMITLKGISNSAKKDTCGEIQRKLMFVFDNQEHISHEEGIYMLKKYLSKRES